MNLDRFSLARFSIGNADDQKFDIKMSFYESMNSSAGASVPVEVHGQFNEAFGRVVQGTISIGILFDAEEAMDKRCTMSAQVLVSLVQVDTVRSIVNGIKDVNIADNIVSDLVCRAYVSKRMPETMAARGDVMSSVHASKDVVADCIASETLMSNFEATMQSMKTTKIQVTIPPGGELRIDSGTYTVLLNGENALHTQSGDWIFMLPALSRLNIETIEGGQLSGQLIYTERYL